METEFKHGKFKLRLVELEDSVEHTLSHASACELVNEAKKDFLDMIDLYKKMGYSIEGMKAVVTKWFGNP